MMAGGPTRPLWTPIFAKPHVGSKPEGHLAYQYRSSLIQPAADCSMMGFSWQRRAAALRKLSQVPEVIKINQNHRFPLSHYSNP
jgi:hypothetical protein